MKIEDYSRLAIRTAKPLELHKQHMHFVLGIHSEAGELADCVKAHVVYGKPLDLVNIKEECGDMLWFLNYMADMVGNPFQNFAEFAFNRMPTMSPATPRTDPTWYIELGSYSISLSQHASDLVTAFYDYVTASDDEQQLASVHLEAAVGDMLLGIRGLLNTCGMTLSEAMQANIDKLAVRYADQIYKDEAALSRNLDQERAALGDKDVQTNA